MKSWITCWRRHDEWLSGNDICKCLKIQPLTSNNLEYAGLILGLRALCQAGLFERIKQKRVIDTKKMRYSRLVWVYKPKKWLYDAMPTHSIEEGV